MPKSKSLSDLLKLYEDHFNVIKIKENIKCKVNSSLKSFPRIFFSIWVFFHNYSQTTGLQGKREDISLTPHYHFHPLQRHLDISRVITAESSPVHIGSSRTQTGHLLF